MSDIVIDTNVIIWYFGDYSRLTSLAEKTVDLAAETGTVHVASISIVELTYLAERNRVSNAIVEMLRDALDDESTSFRLAELTREVADEIEHIDRSIVADMPDRIISATARHLGIPLVTSDSDIRKLTNVATIW